MAGKSARIDSPEILKEFRAEFLKFAQACRQALAAVDSDVRSADGWLSRDQRLTLKMQIRKCDEAVNNAQREYNQARWDQKNLSRSSGVEEKRVLDRAKRRKEELEQKAAAVEKWIVMLDDQVGKLNRPCLALSNLLDSTTPRALADIDRMLDRLDEYLRPAPPEQTP
jgi:seryl-tRNA synthetase